MTDIIATAVLREVPLPIWHRQQDCGSSSSWSAAKRGEADPMGRILRLAIVVPVLWVPLALAVAVSVQRRRATRAGPEAARLAVLDAVRWQTIERWL